MKPLILLSLPRAGSTLLQRLLMTHPSIGSCGEPWLALPLAKMFAAGESFSTYGHASLVRSGQHLIEQLPEGRDDLLDAGGNFLYEIYGKLASAGTEYFLDKTPRYYKIIPELIKMLPDASFVILRRDPVAVFASMLNYIEGHMHLLPTWEQDINEGIAALGEGIELLGDRAYVVNYEDLVISPDQIIGGLLEFIGLDQNACQIDALATTHVPRGDPTGVCKYLTVSKESLAGWMKTLNSSTKKRVALNWLGEVSCENFDKYGFDKSALMEKLKSLPVKVSLKDEFSWQTGRLYFGCQLNVVRWGFRRKKMKEAPTLY